MSYEPWIRLGVSREHYEATQARVHEEAAQNPTPEQVDRELRTLSDREIERLASEDVPPKPWAQYDADERRAWRARNELARRQRLAARQAAQAAEEAARQAERDAAITAEVEAFKAQARAVFPGTAAEFDRAWPGILAHWQEEQTIERIRQAEAAARRTAGF